MTDAELLREYAGFSGTPVDMRAVLFSSADRIEKLEAALRRIIDRAEYRMGHHVTDAVCSIAREALEGKDDPQTDL
jgi:hypothetical protein